MSPLHNPHSYFYFWQGGITSSDLAVKAMGATRAEVAGQALPGVPLWRLGPGSRYPGVPYIVFPGEPFDKASTSESLIQELTFQSGRQKSLRQNLDHSFSFLEWMK